MRIARTQNILVRNWTCPSGRLTAGSRSVRGLRAYRRLFFCSSRGIAHFPAAAGRTTSPPAPATFVRAAPEAFATTIRIETATRPEPNSLSIPAAVRSTLIRALSLVAWPAASNSARRRPRSSRSIAVVGCICAWRVNPCRPKSSGSYLIIHLRLCLWSPAFPVPPRPPAPRPCFLPRPCVRLPLNLRVLETILRLLDDHPQKQFVDLLSAVTEFAAVLIAAFHVPESSPSRRKSNHVSYVSELDQPGRDFREVLAFDLDFFWKRDGLVRHRWRGGDLADEDLFGARLNLQTIRLLAADLQFGRLPQGFECGQGVVHRRLRVALREPPGIRDAGELQHALGHVAHREPDPLGSGLER